MNATRSVDVAVIGGGPAGYSAALAAAAQGATVVLAEAERLGGTCVHWACIPTNAMLSSAHASLEARELGFLGIMDAGDAFDLRRAAARKDAAVKALSGGVAAALRAAGVEVLAGRGVLTSPSAVAVGLADGTTVDVEAAAVVLAAGARWEVPAIPGFAADNVLTADLVQALPAAPATALVVGGGAADTAFAVEYAVLLAAAGTAVTLAIPGSVVVPALDADLDPLLSANLETLGIVLAREVDVLAGDLDAEADVAVVVDRRVPAAGGIGLDRAGVAVVDGAISVDRSCRTSVAGVLAAGDVTGGRMLTAAAMHMGGVAGSVAAGGRAATRLASVPHLLHTFPEVAWIGVSEAVARAGGADVAVGVSDLAFNARAVATGRADGAVKLVADAATGEVLGVHVVGSGAAEILALASVVMQAELSTNDLAALLPWHPSAAEALIDAATKLA